MMNFSYVHILKRLNAPEHYYVRFAQDLHGWQETCNLTGNGSVMAGKGLERGLHRP